jgi:hypothetical protein
MALFAACAAALGIVRTSGYSLALPPGRRLEGLRVWQFVVFQHVARRVAALDPAAASAGVVTPDDVDVAGFVDGYMARAPGAMRRDLSRFLAYVEHLAPLAIGMGSRFTRLDPAEQDRVLASLESSSNDLLRAGFEGIKSLAFMGYYRDARTWGIIGYGGPLVAARPAGAGL